MTDMSWHVTDTAYWGQEFMITVPPFSNQMHTSHKRQSRRQNIFLFSQELQFFTFIIYKQTGVNECLG